MTKDFTLRRAGVALTFARDLANSARGQEFQEQWNLLIQIQKHQYIDRKTCTKTETSIHIYPKTHIYKYRNRYTNTERQIQICVNKKELQSGTVFAGDCPIKKVIPPL